MTNLRITQLYTNYVSSNLVAFDVWKTQKPSLFFEAVFDGATTSFFFSVVVAPTFFDNNNWEEKLNKETPRKKPAYPCYFLFLQTSMTGELLPYYNFISFGFLWQCYCKFSVVERQTTIPSKNCSFHFSSFCFNFMSRTLHYSK